MIKTKLTEEIKNRLLSDEIAMAAIAVSRNVETRAVKPSIIRDADYLSLPHVQDVIRMVLQLPKDAVITETYEKHPIHE